MPFIYLTRAFFFVPTSCLKNRYVTAKTRPKKYENIRSRNHFRYIFQRIINTGSCRPTHEESRDTKHVEQLTLLHSVKSPQTLIISKIWLSLTAQSHLNIRRRTMNFGSSMNHFENILHTKFRYHAIKGGGDIALCLPKLNGY